MPDTPSKVCFATIGATASFDNLLRAILSHKFFVALKEQNYTHLIIQHGSGEGKALFDKLSSDPSLSRYAVKISGFEFAKEDFNEHFVRARDGVCVSHAGSGTILEALRCGTPLIVVPNPDLLDNHQDELAEQLAKQGYVIHAKLSNVHACLTAAEILRKKHLEWPPVNSGKHRGATGLKGVLDEETGFLD